MNRVLFIGAALALAGCVIVFQQSRIRALRTERDTYRDNTSVLMRDVEKYRVSDSLNAARAGVLALKIDEFEKYRAEDAALIERLRAKNRDLQAVTTAQMQTITELQGQVRDSIVYVNDTIVQVLRCVDIADRWLELHGCATPSGEFSGTIISRDSILIASTVEYKRFLGFLWKTKRVKDREINVVSKNPHTTIEGVEYIEIEK